MKRALDLFLIYQFLRRLVTPFEKWDAYKLGVIDNNGKVILDKKDRDKKQKDSWGYYDRLLANLKKLLGKIPGGKTRLASFAAALLLLREQNLDPDDTEYLAECLDHYMVEAKQLLTEENVSAGVTNVVGGGDVAGLGVGPDGEPPVMTAMQRKKKKKKKVNEVLDKPTPSVEKLAIKHKVSVQKILAQLAKGIKVEKEHTSDPDTAKEIALDHIAELPDYYDRLEKMEK